MAESMKLLYERDSKKVSHEIAGRDKGGRLEKGRTIMTIGICILFSLLLCKRLPNAFPNGREAGCSLPGSGKCPGIRKVQENAAPVRQSETR